MLLVEQHLEVSIAVGGALVGEYAAYAEAETGAADSDHVEEGLAEALIWSGRVAAYASRV